MAARDRQNACINKPPLVLVFLVLLSCWSAGAVRQLEPYPNTDSGCGIQEIGVRTDARGPPGGNATVSFFNGCPGCQAVNITFNCGEVDPLDFPTEQHMAPTCLVNQGRPLAYGQFARVPIPHLDFLTLLRVIDVTYAHCQIYQ